MRKIVIYLVDTFIVDLILRKWYYNDVNSTDGLLLLDYFRTVSLALLGSYWS